MNTGHGDSNFPGLGGQSDEDSRRLALRERCNQYRTRLQPRDPCQVARLAGVEIRPAAKGGGPVLCGEHWSERYEISWPELVVTGKGGGPVPLIVEALWLHYLDRADGHPLSGRWVNLREIGGLFYQQAFQGYSGGKLARAWGEALEGLESRCRAEGGWQVKGLGDLAFQWRVLPRLPVCLCYRRLPPPPGAWATVLFDSAANHYVAVDVAAITGSQLVDRLMPPVSS